jgi:hypothetical protein
MTRTCGGPARVASFQRVCEPPLIIGKEANAVVGQFDCVHVCNTSCRSTVGNYVAHRVLIRNK